MSSELKDDYLKMLITGNFRNNKKLKNETYKDSSFEKNRSQFLLTKNSSD